MRTVLIVAALACATFGVAAITAETILPRFIAWAVSMGGALLFGMALEHTTTHRKVRP